ncbi:hypothetical protein GGS24DRAFT_252167 [Hypoxylon argillaceum]|nr:hypothetical protein GGS24DRAFT_252167 [Hypoxylon argillaceum]
MSQQQDDRLQDIRMSSQVSREEEEISSNRATSGSSDPDSDEFNRLYTPSRCSEPSVRPPKSRRFLEDLQAAQTNRLGSLDDGSFRGLTPPPLPFDMLPSKKRPLCEVLGDESPPRKDKLTVEIEQLAREEPASSRASPAGPSGTQNVTPIQSHRRKKSKVGGVSLTRATGDSAAPSGRHGHRTLESRVGLARDASRAGDQDNSD